MHRENPLISVIIPAYNAESTIERTLNSVLAQTYENIEVLIVDDGSEDRTVKILEDFFERDRRIKLFKQKHAGVAAARNLAIEKSSADYVAPIDADDIWHPQKLQLQLDCLLSADPSVGLVYAWQIRIDENDVILGPITIQFYEDFNSVEGHVVPALIHSNFLGSASVPLIRRSCFQRVGGYSTALRLHQAQGCEDWDLYLRIAAAYEFRVVRQFLIGYRQGRSSMSRNIKSMAKSYDLVVTNAPDKPPMVSDWIYRASAGNFALYLSGLSSDSGGYLDAITFALRGLTSDPIQVITKPRQLNYVLKLLVKLVLSPIIKLWGLDPHHWFRQAKGRLMKTASPAAVDRVIHFSSIEHYVDHERRDPMASYGGIRWRRWLRLLQACRDSRLAQGVTSEELAAANKGVRL